MEYLVDTSAFTRLSRDPELRAAWRRAAAAGVLSICPLTELEIFYSARSRQQRAEWEEALRRVYCWVVVPDRVYQRAAEVQEALTERGKHRSAGAVDLLVAATAEEHRMTILHFDKDFSQVAKVTGQPTRWVAEPGAVN
ncbi:PIN domain nuclease [Actinoplanes sp. NPDC024001]|uniref:PIN domain nuclease n=1 Tax=Actinoplanes sp. NPDC024001 TaxID=3154598 RepID=UPI0033DDF758